MCQNKNTPLLSSFFTLTDIFPIKVTAETEITLISLTQSHVAGYICQFGSSHHVLTITFANLSLCSSANSTFLQHPSSINTNGCYKSLLLTFFFCFRTVNLELCTSTYSLYRQTVNVQASTKVTLLPVCFYCLVILRQRLRLVFHDCFGAI